MVSDFQRPADNTLGLVKVMEGILKSEIKAMKSRVKGIANQSQQREAT